MISCLRNGFNQFAEWLAFDHPDHWAKVLPPVLAPAPPLPFVKIQGHENEYSALPEEIKKIQEIAWEIGKKEHKQRMAWYKVRQIPLDPSDSPSPRRIVGIDSRMLPGKIVKGASYGGHPCARRIDRLCGLISFNWDGERSDGGGRAVMAKRMRLAIEKLHLDRLYVPDKKVVIVEESKQEVAVIEKLEIMRCDEAKQYMKKLLHDSPAEAKKILTQFFTLIKETGASDMKFGDNFSFIKSGEHRGKLAFFDTESFGLIGMHQKERGDHSITRLKALCHFDTDRNVYFSGGLRNLDLALGDAVNNNVVYDRHGTDGFAFLNDEEWSTVRNIYWRVKTVTIFEMTSNFVKAWTLRLLFPATVIAALVIPHFQAQY